MKTLFGKLWHASAAALLVLATCAAAQNAKDAGDLTGHYEGTAKDASGEVISVTLDLTEKDGAITGHISSSRGDFPITGGSHQGKTVKLEFEAEGTLGTISLEAKEDKLVGTWSAGDNSGPVEVKRTAVTAPKEKS